MLLILALSGSESFAPISYESSHSELIESSSEIIKSVLAIRFPEVNFVKASKSSDEANDILESILANNQMDFAYSVEEIIKIQSVNATKKTNIFILLDDVESFKNFYEKKLSAAAHLSSGFFLLALIRRSIDGIEDIFRSFWRKGISNVDVMVFVEETVKILTFMPFTETKCNNTAPIVVNEYRKGRFKKQLENIFPKKFSNLQRCPIIISTYEDELSVTKTENSGGSFELSGFDMELLDGLSELLNFKKVFKFIEGPLPFGMVFANGTTTGALGDVVNGRSQIAIGRISVADFRTAVLDAIPYYSFPEVFVMSPGRKLTNLEKLMQPFHLFVWIALLVVLTGTFITILALNFSPKKLQALVYGSEISSPGLNVLIAVLGLSQTSLPSQNFSRLLLMTFLIFCLIIRNAYQGSLYQFLQQDRNYFKVKSIQDLIDQDFELYVYPITDQEYFRNQSNVRFVHQPFLNEKLERII